jgi:hypothetical protein
MDGDLASFKSPQPQEKRWMLKSYAVQALSTRMHLDGVIELVRFARSFINFGTVQVANTSMA